MRKYLWACIYGILLTAFTVYIALDTFVIVREFEIPEQTGTNTAAETDAYTDDDKQNGSDTDNSSPDDPDNNEPVITEDSYTDENISIHIYEYRYNDTNIYVADIVLSSPEYLKTAFAKGKYGKNIIEKTSTIAKNAGAILAVNGDYYGAREKGYVIRNGTLYRDKSNNGEDLVVFADGSMQNIKENNVTVDELLAQQEVLHIFSFGPGLVSEGETAVTKDYEIKGVMVSNPRTAIGIVDDLHYVFVVSDGRTDESKGLSLYELGEFLRSELDVETAYNLDGGGSSTMVFNGKIINKPTTYGDKISERSVSDIVYIGY